MTTLPGGIVTDLFGDNPLNYVYVVALIVGVMYSIFLIFFHGIGDALGDLDLHLDATHTVDLHAPDGHDASEATGVSLLAIASFVSSFGAFGLISVTLLGAGVVVSFALALAGGIVVGILAQIFFLYILSPTISSEVHQARLIGQVAEITTPIPARGVGQIAFVAEGSRVTYAARAADEVESLQRGTPVRIERIVGGLAYVTPLD